MASLDVVTVGSALIDHVYTLSNLPKPDGGAFVHDYTTTVGGVAANVGSGLAALDRDVGIVTRLGEDATEEIKTTLRTRGLDVTQVRSGSEESSYTLILRGPTGEKMIVAGGQSVPQLQLDTTDGEYLTDANVVFSSAYAPDAVVTELVAARERGEIAHLVFDLAGPLSELEGRGTTPETIDRVLSVADLFVVGEVAARSYFGEDFEDTIAALRQRSLPRAAVTRGDEGAVLLDGDTTVDISAIPVPVADTTGAGDAFTAGLIHAWVLGEASPADAGRFAAGVAALNCSAEGACGCLPDETSVQALIDEY
ncbi:ribokinase [Halogranum amylolyticum]|uniref:Ribokinase n=1 Tax=Halogranum amylolyticum TaxID=660520 RepID=A0A1H8UC60_9EURY|nr:carbohydrate kinase family protein [Halogranum amylolyticum]SEP00781.1 ribokinase [Halogranum amylolyticum]